MPSWQARPAIIQEAYFQCVAKGWLRGPKTTEHRLAGWFRPKWWFSATNARLTACHASADSFYSDPNLMRLFLLLFCVSLALGCGTANTDSAPNSPRSYYGSASVGDFVTITVDPAKRTLAYSNLSNEDSGVIPYEVNEDGSYTLNDREGNLVAAYEAPDYALLVESTQAGPSHDELALIVATPSKMVESSAWAGQAYNYMQFRTNGGGFEVGSLSFDEEGNLTLAGFSPYRSLNGANGYRGKTFSMAGFQRDATGNFLTNQENDGTFDYIFNQGNRIFALDTAEGTTLALRTRPGKNFDPSLAGKYKAFYYQKEGARLSGDDEELGKPSLDDATVWISRSGQLIAKDSQGGILLAATLQPAGSESDLSCRGGCNGLFAFRFAQSNFRQEVFAAFTDRTILFSSFRATLPRKPRETYDYLYGVGLK